MSTTDASTRPTKKGHGCLTTIIGIVVVVVALPGLLSMCDSSTGGEDSDTLAKVACQDHIKKGLKDPSSAQFSDVAIDGPVNHQWTITGVVRATNSFGGTVVAMWTCQAQNNDGTYYTSYTLDE